MCPKCQSKFTNHERDEAMEWDHCPICGCRWNMIDPIMEYHKTRLAKYILDNPPPPRWSIPEAIKLAGSCHFTLKRGAGRRYCQSKLAVGDPRYCAIHRAQKTRWYKSQRNVKRGGK